MSTLYKDYLPANARIVIDYTKEDKDKVKFSYPQDMTYEQAVKKYVSPTIRAWWTYEIIAAMTILILFITAMTFVGIISLVFFNYSAPSDFIYMLTLGVDWWLSTPAIPTLSDALLRAGIGLFFTVFLLATPNIISWYLKRDKERLSKHFPNFGYWCALMGRGMNEKVFTSTDISSNRVIVPSFHNVWMKFQATEDFDKYLERIEILEIPYTCLHLSSLTGFIKKREVNEREFSAVFHFSQAPLKGSLEVRYI